MSHRPPSKLSLAFTLAKLALRTRPIRRQLMFVLTIAMMLFAFLGAYPLAGFLSAHPWLFLFYWGFTFLLVLAVMLLALYDMLRIKKEMSDSPFEIDFEKIRRELEEEEKKKGE